MWRYKRGSEVVRGALLQSTLISQPGISGLATARRAAGDHVLSSVPVSAGWAVAA